jgi:hypothetical protein
MILEIWANFAGSTKAEIDRVAAEEAYRQAGVNLFSNCTFSKNAVPS